jgi:abortive infection bacteriophage resistance protein
MSWNKTYGKKYLPKIGYKSLKSWFFSTFIEEKQKTLKPGPKVKKKVFIFMEKKTKRKEAWKGPGWASNTNQESR